MRFIHVLDIHFCFTKFLVCSNFAVKFLPAFHSPRGIKVSSPAHLIDIATLTTKYRPNYGGKVTAALGLLNIRFSPLNQLAKREIKYKVNKKPTKSITKEKLIS